MAFFNPNQQSQLMAQMFQNPQGGGMIPPTAGQGGAGSGLNVGPSFDGPQGAPGIAPLPFTGPPPDFTMGPYVPGTPTGIVNLQNQMPPQGMEPMPYRPQDGYGSGRPPIGPMMPPAPGSNPGMENMPLPSPSGSRVRGGMGDNPLQDMPRNRMPERTPATTTEDDQRRKLIEAIMRQQFGG